MLDNSLDAFVNPQHPGNASGASLLVAITFHFVPGRAGYLETVLRSLAGFSVSRRDIVVITNTTDAAEQKEIRRVFEAAGLTDGQDARIEVARGLAHPYDLTWAHKKLISDLFLAAGSPYSHFVYIEDDEQLTFENFSYFLAARDILRPFGLIPAFLRTEWSAERKCPISADATAPISLAVRPFISNGVWAFVEADNPYCGSFIFDRELAREYVASHSFDPERSRAVSSWNVRERSAMGLTFENPPAPFIYRTVVPVSVAARRAPSCAWLAHLPNNYVSNPHTRFGTVPMVELFADDFGAGAGRQGTDYKFYPAGRGSVKILFKRLLRSAGIGKLRIKLLLKRLLRSHN